MRTYAYDMSNAELLLKLIGSASKVGSSCSDLVIDIAGPVHQEELTDLKVWSFLALMDKPLRFVGGIK